MNKSVKISFLGDIALVGNYNDLYESNLNPFEDVSKLLKESDYVIGNLEGVCVGEHGENLKKKPRLKTKPETLNFLRTLNINLVTLAQNHIYDNLLDGFLKTTKALKNNNIEYLGAGLSRESSEKPLYKIIGGFVFCFLNYITHDTNPNLPNEAEVYLNNYNLNRIKEDIEQAKTESDFIVVLLHWGGRVEGGYFPDFNQPTEAKLIIDSGADLIVGHHTHTLQPYEIYKGKYIFYSLGNFCFAGFESDGKYRKLVKGRRTQSGILTIEFYKDGYTIGVNHIENRNSYIYLNNSLDKKYTLRLKVFSVLKSNKNLWRIYFFKIKYIDRLIRFVYRKIV